MEKLIKLLETVLGKSKRTARNNIAFCCPFCNSTKLKLEISLEPEGKQKNRPWHCWVCNASGKRIESLFKKLKVTREQSIELYSILDSSIYYKKSKITSSSTQIQLPNEYKSLTQYATSIEAKNALKFLKSRGITEIDLARFNIGICTEGTYKNHVIVPSFTEDHRLNYFIARSYYDTEFRYHNPNYSKDIIAFESLINWKLPIVLVEGVFDAMAVKFNAIPILGKIISTTLHLKILEKRVKEIYICLDWDARSHALKMAEYFIGNGLTVYLVDLPLNEDPSSLGTNTIQELIRNTKPLNSSSLLIEKVKIKNHVVRKN